MYKFRKEKREDLLQGRTVKYTAEKVLYITPQYLVLILAGKNKCSKRIAMSIANAGNGTLEDFFEYFEKGE